MGTKSVKEQKEMQESRLIEFYFTDIDVLKIKCKKETIFEKKGQLSFPLMLQKCENQEALLAWKLWVCLATFIRKKIRKNIRKHLPSKGKPIMSFGHKDGIITLATQPWAAKLLGLPEIKIFPCPPYTPLKIYTELMIEFT